MSKVSWALSSPIGSLEIAARCMTQSHPSRSRASIVRTSLISSRSGSTKGSQLQPSKSLKVAADDGMAFLLQDVDQVGSDKTAMACNENLHSVYHDTMVSGFSTMKILETQLVRVVQANWRIGRNDRGSWSPRPPRPRTRIIRWRPQLRARTTPPRRKVCVVPHDRANVVPSRLSPWQAIAGRLPGCQAVEYAMARKIWSKALPPSVMATACSSASTAARKSPLR